MATQRISQSDDVPPTSAPPRHNQATSPRPAKIFPVSRDQFHRDSHCYAKPIGRPMVDTFITEVSQDTWIYFPWDTGLAFQPPIREAGLYDGRSSGIIGRSCALSDGESFGGGDKVRP
jgi:hypothetical protein